MVLEALGTPFSVCSVSVLPNELHGFCFAAVTDCECSLVCETAHAPAHAIAREDGWRAFRVKGTLDFSLVGILARLSELLAKSGIGLFAVSTYQTDYILTKEENFEKALLVLSQNGYTIERV